MTRRSLAPCLALLLLTAPASAGIVLEEGFEAQGKWKKSIRGKGSIELVPGGVRGRCLKITSQDKALVYYSIPLDPKPLRGKRLIVRAKVKLDNVAVGPETYSTAKLHVGVIAGGAVQNRAQRFVGTRDWHDQVLAAPIPADATKIVLDLGIQNGTGTAWFDDLVVTDGVTEHTALSLKTVANASRRGQAIGDGGRVVACTAALEGVPAASIRLGGVDFYVMHGGENFGRTCVMLRGKSRPDLPARLEAVVPVDAKGSRLLFLQAATGVDKTREAPCLVCTVQYADGKSVAIPMREGIDMGPLEAPSDLPNWKVAWTSKAGGKTVGLGVAAWTNPRPEIPIQWLRLHTAGTGAAPIVVAIALDPR